MKGKKTYDHCHDEEKTFDKTHYYFMTNTPKKLRIEGHNLNVIKPYIKNPYQTLYSIVKYENLFHVD